MRRSSVPPGPGAVTPSYGMVSGGRCRASSARASSTVRSDNGLTPAAIRSARVASRAADQGSSICYASGTNGLCAASVRARRTFAAAAGPAESELPEAARDVLRGGTTGPVLELERARLRVGAVPLLRREENGRLGQCIRIAGTGSAWACRNRGHVRRDRDGSHGARARGTTAELPPVRTRGRAARSPRGAPRWWRRERSPTRRGRAAALDRVLRPSLPPRRRLHRPASRGASKPPGIPRPGTRSRPKPTTRFRWNVEGNLPLQRWRAAPREAVRQMLAISGDGHIEVGAMPYTLNAKACSIDELARHLASASRLPRSMAWRSRPRCRPTCPVMVTGSRSCCPRLGCDTWTWRSTGWRAPRRFAGGWDLPAVPLGCAPPRCARLAQRQAPRDGLPRGQPARAGRPGRPDRRVPSRRISPGWANRLPLRGRGRGVGSRTPSRSPQQPYPFDILHLRLQGAISDNAGPVLAPAEIIRRWNEAFDFRGCGWRPTASSSARRRNRRRTPAPRRRLDGAGGPTDSAPRRGCSVADRQAQAKHPEGADPAQPRRPVGRAGGRSAGDGRSV